VFRAETAPLAVHATATATITAVAPEGEIAMPEAVHVTEIEVGPDFGTGETIDAIEAVHAQEDSLTRTTIGPAKRPLDARATEIGTGEIAAALGTETDHGRLVHEPTVGRGLAPF
jgi:hypothetical protein